jgi:seryl-tRNA synthetase
MIDIKLIRENKELVKENIKKKFQDSKLPIVDEIYDLDIKFRETKSKADGLKAENVSKGKPADRAGMLTGDIIIELNGKKITDIYSYMDALGTLKENQTYKVKIKREGKTKELKIKL